MTRSPFLDVDMPDRFVLECMTSTGDWIDWGLFEATMFERQADGAYLCAGHGGSPMWFRCLRQDGSVIHVTDGVGNPFTYRLVPFPGGGYTESTQRWVRAA